MNSILKEGNNRSVKTAAMSVIHIGGLNYLSLTAGEFRTRKVESTSKSADGRDVLSGINTWHLPDFQPQTQREAT